MLYSSIDHCRACGSSNVPMVLDLGTFSLSDFLDTPEAHTDRAPLTLLRCEDCTLVQLAHTVNRERLYSQYWYHSSTQPAMVAALRDVVEDARSRVPVVHGDVVLDIGANDGTLLAQYPEGVIKLAYEPALNLWAELADSGARVVGGFFPPKGNSIYKPARIITSVACFYDVDDPGAFVEGIKDRLADDGVWINQMAYLPETLCTDNFGDVCHEHLTYWSVESFCRLVEHHGLCVNEVEFNPVNGGSMRTVVSRQFSWPLLQDAPSVEHFTDFRHRIEAKRATMQRYLKGLQASHQTVIGYGASTKGATYLQYWGIGSDLLPMIADRNPAKWGKFTPTGQLVCSEEEMRGARPDYLLVLPWHFADAFMEREAELLESGTQMIVPFPTLRVVGAPPRLRNNTNGASPVLSPHVEHVGGLVS